MIRHSHYNSPLNPSLLDMSSIMQYFHFHFKNGR